MHSAVDFVDYGDVCVDFDGVPVEEGGLVTPLAYGIQSRLIKQRIATDPLNRANGAIGCDDGLEFDAAFASVLPGQRGEDRLYAVYEYRRIEMRDVHDAGRGAKRGDGRGTALPD